MAGSAFAAGAAWVVGPREEVSVASLYFWRREILKREAEPCEVTASSDTGRRLVPVEVI